MPEQTSTLSEIRKTAEFSAPIQKVWEAIATAEGLAAWFMPNDFKAELGHEFSIDAKQYGVSPCKVIELDPPRRMSFTWGVDGWVVTFELAEANGKTILTLTHGGWEDKTLANGMPSTAAHEKMAPGWGWLIDQSLRKVVEA